MGQNNEETETIRKKSGVVPIGWKPLDIRTKKTNINKAARKVLIQN